MKSSNLWFVAHDDLNCKFTFERVRLPGINPEVFVYKLRYQRVFCQFEIIINIPLRFVWIPTVIRWFCHYKYFTFSVRGLTLESDVCRRQILTSKVWPRTERGNNMVIQLTLSRLSVQWRIQDLKKGGGCPEFWACPQNILVNFSQFKGLFNRGAPAALPPPLDLPL